MLKMFWRSLWSRHCSHGNQRLAGRMGSQEQAELQLLYRTAPIGMCLLDSELKLLRANGRFADSLGVGGADFRGRSLHELIPNLIDQQAPCCTRVFRTGTPAHSSGSPAASVSRLKAARCVTYWTVCTTGFAPAASIAAATS